MKNESKIFASVTGVCIAAAVVVGTVVANHGGDSRQTPAGNEIGQTAPATVTATVTASPTPVVAVAVSPSTKQAVAPKKRAAVVQQEDPVTEPEPPADPTTSDPAPQAIDNGTGTVDEGGVRRAPIPSDQNREASPVNPLPLGPGAPDPHH